MRFILFLTPIFGLLACEEEASEPRRETPKVVAEPTDTNPPPAPSPGENSGNASGVEPKEGDGGTPSLVFCNNDLEKVFKPTPASCAEEMVRFECCKEKILPRFPSISSQLEAVFLKLSSEIF